MHNGEPTFFEIWEPEVYTGTESYQDNVDVLERIHRQIEERTNGYECILIVGDQQTFDRMMKLKREHAQQYRHIIPFNGEMHFEVHFAHAGWRLWYDPIFNGLIQLYAPEQKVLKPDWTTKEWSYYDDFMFKFTSAAVRYLADITPTNSLDYNLMLYHHRNNATSLLLVRCVLDFALPYVQLRQLLRQTSTAITRKQMLVYYNICMHMCRADKANKFLYSMLCVHAVYLYCNAIPSLKALWDHMSTVSLRGIRGRNIPIDHLCEKINKAAKGIVRGRPSEARIKELVKALNVLMPVEAAYLNLIGGIDSEDKKYYSGKQNREGDISRLVECLQ